MTETLPEGQNLPDRRPFAAVEDVRQLGHGTQQLAVQAARLDSDFVASCVSPAMSMGPS